MAHPGDTCVYVKTNLDTRIAISIHSEATVSQFKEIFCREHKENWPEFGDIQITAVKVEQGDKLYRIVDSMIWSVLFQGIRGDRHINVEVENGDLVTIQADAPSVSTDTESNWQQSVGAPFQLTQPSEDKTKKRKRESDKEKESCGDDKTGDIDVNKDDDVGALSRCSCEAQGTKKLLVFDLNGILADLLGSRAESAPDGISNRPVFIRPFVASFLDFCFERFNVGIWSSRRVKLKYITNLVMGNQAKDLVFGFGQDMCITTEFKTLENTAKPLFLKDLRRVWNHLGACSTCGKRKYDESNTLLVDDSPEKALCNPPHTGIFPHPYKYTDHVDCALGPNGELRKYLERLVDAENVQKFVAENPIGQSAIAETHESWEFYSKVIEKYK
uniref:Mitochondrial import inner membrane translocase subunit TIM50 n=2 Tax=Noccaea caerulescens TaxID=107243 RepID=A0A1J3FVR8_NOCCA